MLHIVTRLHNHALPDPHDEREVMHAPLLKEAADEIEYLYSLLKRAYKYVEFDAHMMNSISRFSPLPQEVQEIHDNTEYASEKLLKELNAKGIY